MKIGRLLGLRFYLYRLSLFYLFHLWVYVKSHFINTIQIQVLQQHNNKIFRFFKGSPLSYFSAIPVYCSSFSTCKLVSWIKFCHDHKQISISQTWSKLICMLTEELLKTWKNCECDVCLSLLCYIYSSVWN